MASAIRKASYREWSASLWGACVAAFGLGAWLSEYFADSLIALVIVAGLVSHAWGMYRIHQRNS